MNKRNIIVGTLVAALVIGIAAMSQAINVRPIGVRAFNENTYRTGLAFDVQPLNYGWNLDAWVLARTPEYTTSFLGLGVSREIFRRDNLSLGVAFGWSADFSNIQNPREGSWGFGLVGSIRF